MCQECVVTSCALELCVGLTFKHFENSIETKLTLTAHVHFISDAVCFLATALLNDGPEAFPALKV